MLRTTSHGYLMDKNSKSHYIVMKKIKTDNSKALLELLYCGML